MKSLSFAAGRAALVAACTLCALAVGSLPRSASAAPAVATPLAAAAPSTEAGALPLRLGAVAEHLFDVAAAAEWTSVQAALQSLREQALRLDGAFEARFDAVGGRIQDLVAARDSLRGDLAEADTAAGAQDARTLVEVANRITLIAGELAQPFAEAHDAPVALKVDAVMFEARRMRHALAWGDTQGYESAQQSFRRLWLDLRAAPGLDPAKLDALDRALTLAALTRNAQTMAELQRAAQDVVETPGTSVRPAE